MLELYFLIIVTVCAFAIIYYYNTQEEKAIVTKEAFETMYSLQSCPFGYKAFYDPNGDMLCCDGELTGNECMSDNQCALSGSSNARVPNCVDFLLKDYAAKAKSQCPASLPSYYENKAEKMKGCTTGNLNTTMTGPRNNTQPICKIYGTLDENIDSVDSCYNKKHLDEYPCFGNNCTKAIIRPNPNGPILMTVSFTDSSGMHHVSYTRQTVETYFDKVNPNWRQQGFDTSKNINVAEVAKAFYVDRTMSQADVQL